MKRLVLVRTLQDKCRNSDDSSLRADRQGKAALTPGRGVAYHGVNRQGENKTGKVVIVLFFGHLEGGTRDRI